MRAMLWRFVFVITLGAGCLGVVASTIAFEVLPAVESWAASTIALPAPALLDRAWRDLPADAEQLRARIPTFGPRPSSAIVADFTAASCSRADVSAMFDQITAAGAGKIGAIPACSRASGLGSWTSTTPLEWTAPANTTIIGAGSLTTEGGGDATVIIDNVASNVRMLMIFVAPTGLFRWAGITVEGGPSGVLKDGAPVTFVGPGNIRIDHSHWNMHTYTTIPRPGKFLVFYETLRGVLDHNIFDFSENGSVYLYNWDGTSNQGNDSWATATDFGGSSLYFEDNLYRGDITITPSRVVDCYSGGRGAWRFNTLAYVSGPEPHATGHSGDDRGCRAFENYGNLYTTLPGQPQSAYDLHDSSSGTNLIWGNVADTASLIYGILFKVVRRDNAAYSQTATPNGWGYCGTEFNGTGSAWDGNTPSAVLGYPCIDQPGRGMSDLITGSFPTKINSTTGTIAWTNQALEPIYIWNNTLTPNGGTFYLNDSGSRVVADRDYYEQASGVQTTSSSPFNGTTGTGWGTLANRPATCTTGVGYFATDQGSWNSSSSNPRGVQQNGADGLFYKCTSANTWTLTYTPRAYPHSCTTGSC